MRRVAVSLLAAIVLVGLVAPSIGATRVAAAAPVPKVVIVVGPAGAATDRYRAEAVKAAAVARQYTPDVTEVYSPNATWPAVKQALQGASLVVYMGHGNGWPSRYRDSLYPPSQNGFGLNPKAGSGDSSHQYFGEGPIAASIKLADNAVVLLNHLCYASGNTEPGLPEGTLDQAKQRVDNFAAGFIKAGAAAVIAEAYTSPNYMIRSILGAQRGIETAWKAAPSANHNAFGFESSRSPGYVAEMDPEHLWSGFTRSIVLKRGLAPADVLRGARGSARVASTATPSAIALAPSLIAAGITPKQPRLTSTAAASKIRFVLPYKAAHRGEMPKSVMASVRWDPLDVAAAAATPAPATAPDPSATTGGGAVPDSTSAPATTGDATAPMADAAPTTGGATAPTADAAPPDLGLVVAEQLGDLVAPAKVKLTKGSFSFSLATPSAPGRYRLTVTLHDANGVAFDAATQALVPSLIVRVTGPLDAEIIGPTSLDVAPGAVSDLSLWAANLGQDAWGYAPSFDPAARNGTDRSDAAQITAQWVALGATGASAADQLASAAAASVTPAELPSGLEPGTMVPATLRLYAPSVAGDYLLILDIQTPSNGSLIAHGLAPTIIRVHVAEPVAPAAAPVPSVAPTSETATEPGAAASQAAPAASGAEPAASEPSPAASEDPVDTAPALRQRPTN